jgi:hypothetical protein
MIASATRIRKISFHLAGFYYAQPYWTGESSGIQSYRASCGEGGMIVDDSGHSRVRTIECGGRTFTCMGHFLRTQQENPRRAGELCCQPALGHRQTDFSFSKKILLLPFCVLTGLHARWRS